MRSTRLAVLAVAAGTGLLAWSTAGVTGISATLPAASSPATVRVGEGAVRAVDVVRDHEHGHGFDHDGDGPHHGGREA
jgi:hypothetical protein